MLHMVLDTEYKVCLDPGSLDQGTSLLWGGKPTRHQFTTGINLDSSNQSLVQHTARLKEVDSSFFSSDREQ